MHNARPYRLLALVIGALSLLSATAAMAFDPILSVYLSGGSNPVEGTSYYFSVQIQLDPSAHGLQQVQNGSVNFGDGYPGISFSVSNGGFVNTYSLTLSSQKIFYTAGSFDGTVSAKVYWVDSGGANRVTTVSTPNTVTVDNVAPRNLSVYCDYSQPDGLGGLLPNPHVPRGVPFTFYGGANDPGATTLTASWDLNEDGQYNEAIYSQSNATGFFPTAQGYFYNLGTRFVRLKVADAQGGSTTLTFPFVVDFQQPTAQTGNASAVASHSATLTGSMDLKGMVSCVGVFEYGLDTNYGTAVEVPLNAADVSSTTMIIGLQASQTYHYRYSVRDGGDLMAYGSDATFTTAAGGPPVGAADVALSTGVGSTTIDVLANDSDPDHDSLSIVAVSTPGFGAAAIVDGKVVYTPSSKFRGKDSFTYDVSDGTTTTPGVAVTITSNKGTYTALVSLPAPIMAAPESGNLPPVAPPTYSGVLKLTLGFDDEFTGKLTLGAKSYPVKGKFDAAGNFQFVIDRKEPAPDLTLTLALDLSDPAAPAPRVSGTVSDGTNTYDIDGGRVSDPKTFPGAVVAKYAVAIDPPADANLPQGYGYGFLTVKKGGAATFVGKRNDGKPFAFAGKATDGTNWLFIKGYVPNPNGNVAARVEVRDDGTNDLTGTFNWNKSVSTKGTYQQAFNVELNFVGSRYTAPAKAVHALTFTAVAPAAATANVTLIDSNRTALPFSPLNITFDSKDSFTATTTGTDLLTGKTARPAGTFAGSFIHPTAAKVKFAGVLLQRQNIARGLFSTPTGTGAVEIAPQ